MADSLSLRDSIYQKILSDIMDNEFKPNQVLNEKQLIEKYGCSKSPVREALISLCDENVLRSIPRYGYEVVKITTEDVRELLQFRFTLEVGMLLQCSAYFTEAVCNKLTALNEQCNEQKDINIWSHWSCNTEFHLYMMSVCQNSYAVSQLQRCLSRLKRAYAQFYWNKWDSTILPLDTKNHSMIIDSLRSRDFDGIVKYLKADLNDFGGLHDWF